jgi:hypothetical protein
MHILAGLKVSGLKRTPSREVSRLLLSLVIAARVKESSGQGEFGIRGSSIRRRISDELYVVSIALLPS